MGETCYLTVGISPTHGQSANALYEFPAQELPRQNNRRHRKGAAASEEHQEQNVPSRTVLVKPGKVDRMQSVIEPARDPRIGGITADNARGARVDIIAGISGIAEENEENRQRAQAMAVE